MAAPVRIARLGRPRQRRQAQSTVEFAICVPVFLVLLFGFLDVARALFAYGALVESASNAARVAAIPANMGTPATVLNAFNNTNLTLAAYNGTVTFNFYQPGHTPSANSADLTTGACAVPLSTATCTLPSTSTYTSSSYSAGVVQIVATSTFYFVPVFQAPFGVGLFNPSATLNYTAMGYIG